MFFTVISIVGIIASEGAPRVLLSPVNHSFGNNHELSHPLHAYVGNLEL